MSAIAAALCIDHRSLIVQPSMNSTLLHLISLWHFVLILLPVFAYAQVSSDDAFYCSMEALSSAATLDRVC